MHVAIGLVLVGLVLYGSTLSYVLRTYSRGRLAAYLSEEAQRLWYARLDRHESELQALASLVRLTAILLTIVWVSGQYLVGRDGPLKWSALLSPTLVNLIILFVAGISVPHALATHAGEAILARSLTLLWWTRYALYPVARVLAFFELLIRRLLGKSEAAPAKAAERLEQEILDAVTEGEFRGAVDEEQKEIIESVFALPDTQVSQIMTPRTEMVALPVGASRDEVRQTILQAGHSRIPVYEESLDHIIGVLYAKDLIRLGDAEPFDIRRIMRAVPFVPETKTIDQLLRQFRQEKVHIAIVLDEYGGTAGLVTIEDILEELVGEIDDEYDRAASPAICRVDAETVEVDARVRVDELNKELEIDLPEDGDYDTVGGFIFAALGRIPRRGDEFTHGNLHFVITDAEPRRINRLRIRVQRQAPAP